jgi:hypothetical protein
VVLKKELQTYNSYFIAFHFYQYRLRKVENNFPQCLNESGGTPLAFWVSPITEDGLPVVRICVGGKVLFVARFASIK